MRYISTEFLTNYNAGSVKLCVCIYIFLCVCVWGGLTQYECKQQSGTETHTHGQCYLVETTVAPLRFNPAAT